MKHEDFKLSHKEHGDSWALFLLFQSTQLIAQQLNIIMATQAQLAADLKIVLAEQQKTKAEIVFVQASVDTLTAKVAELQAVIDAGGTGAEASQELIDAVAAVKAAAQEVDDLIPDLPSPTPNTPVISSALTASGAVGSPFSYQITASNSPTEFGAAPMPEGLSVDAAGLISGAPSAAGESTIGLTATNAAGVGQASLVLTVA